MVCPSSLKYAIIYKIITTADPDYPVYIGSTTLLYPSQRMAIHRHGYKKWLENKATNYCSSYEIMAMNGLETCKMKIIEKYPCKTKKELQNKERIWIERLNCVNKNVPTRSKHEYYQENKEKIVASQKKYYEKNKDKISDYQKKYLKEHPNYYEEYRKKNEKKMIGYRKKFLKNNKDYFKNYYLDNKEKIKGYQKAYRDKNKS